MKKYVLLPLVAIALSLTMTACKGGRSGSRIDSVKADSMAGAEVDSIINSGNVKKDSTKTGSDTTKKTDTAKK